MPSLPENAVTPKSETMNHCVASELSSSLPGPLATAVITYTPGCKSPSTWSTGKAVVTSWLSVVAVANSPDQTFTPRSSPRLESS
jgi:hypothetical protein